MCIYSPYGKVSQAILPWHFISIRQGIYATPRNTLGGSRSGGRSLSSMPPMGICQQRQTKEQRTLVSTCSQGRLLAHLIPFTIIMLIHPLPLVSRLSQAKT